ncbi:hypothetical protein WN51_02949 [Melipona quadrifasciata]|uniref:Uncharacterized protein n=1 Tax=Melipona quadrifasciata TaxID=166423 RepID=A0A0M9AB63_9HYME|nr:hypothetical protein WN51_02949 [Melipona quadrifasciata]
MHVLTISDVFNSSISFDSDLPDPRRESKKEREEAPLEAVNGLYWRVANVQADAPLRRMVLRSKSRHGLVGKKYSGVWDALRVHRICSFGWVRSIDETSKKKWMFGRVSILHYPRSGCRHVRESLCVLSDLSLQPCGLCRHETLAVWLSFVLQETRPSTVD